LVFVFGIFLRLQARKIIRPFFVFVFSIVVVITIFLLVIVLLIGIVGNSRSLPWR